MSQESIFLDDSDEVVNVDEVMAFERFVTAVIDGDYPAIRDYLYR